MQRKYLVRAALILLLIAGSYFVLWSATRDQVKKETCKENMGECSKSKDDNNNPSGESLIETFSRQFISSSIIEY